MVFQFGSWWIPELATVLYLLKWWELGTLQLPVDPRQTTSVKLGNGVRRTTEGECEGLDF